MIDVTEQIQGSDTRQKVMGAKLTRLDLIYIKLNMALETINKNRMILFTVYEGDEFVEKLRTRSIEDIKEVIRYYNDTFAMSITTNKQNNEVKLHLDSYLKKYADNGFEE